MGAHAFVDVAGVGRVARGPASRGWARDLLTAQSAVRRANGSLAEIIQAVTVGAIRAIPTADTAVVAIRSGETLRIEGASGCRPIDVGMSLPIFGTLSGHALATGEPQLCPDTTVDRRVSRAKCDALGIGAIITVPLPLHGEQIGVLEIYSERADAFGEEDLLIAQLLAGTLTLGFANKVHAGLTAAHEDLSRRFAVTFEQAAVGLAHVSPDGSFTLVNTRFCTITGYDRDELLLGGFQQITHPADLESDLAHLAELVAGRVQSYAMEKRYVRKDGSVIWVNLTVSLVRKPNGDPDFFVSVIEDITVRKAAERAAELDALTGLLNRRGLTERLRRIAQRRRAAEQTLALAYLDLDGFKAVNDAFGHAVGDRCLTQLAGAIRGCLRTEDQFARLGGDEFVVLLPAVDAAAASEVLRRVREAVTASAAQSEWALSVSIGAVVVPATLAAEPAALLGVADRLMYRAKAARLDQPLVETLDRLEPAAALR